MASTSASSSIQRTFKYDVLLSFSGEDTLTTFVDPLFHVLQQKGIITHKYDESIEKGERISEQHTRSIQDSRFHIIVFSKNYASSSWCLDELVKIMECQKMTTELQTAYPIFYDVEPTEVHNQSGAVGKAFAKHVRGSWSFVVLLSSIFSFLEACCNGFSCVLDLEKEDNVGRWRNALKEAASLAGMELKNTFNGCEAKYIQQVVEEVSRKLQFFNLSVDGKLVGRETQVIGGGGETTLPRNICDHTSIRLEGESSVGKRFKYDVFLSFRGEDTRKTFVDHLYHALHNRGIITYKDDEKIEQGKRINEQLMRSIEDSRIYIIVFSKNYASSSWCLDELVKIMECHKTTGRTAYPVFFNVEPTEVRHQSGAVKEAFAKHEKNEVAGIWRDAMKEAADLAGRELKTTFDGHEAKFIQKIVEDISLELRFIDTSVDEKLIGMETRVKHVVSSLENGSDDVRLIGIKGIGGGGKTTLARAVFDHISIWFEGKSFVENVREASKGSGLKKLQKQVLKDVLNDGGIDVTSVSEGKNMLKKMMGSRKILVVLDDVDDIEQLEALAGDRTWFKAGSTIIITTRDKHVLIAHQVKSIHDVNLLSHEEGIRLFCKYAFGKEIPIEGYKELSEKVVHYAEGLPLTIKVLGSSLCGKAVCEWDDAIKRLKTIPEEKTLKRLEISYVGLENDHKEVFLEVACILKGELKDYAIRILESCGFHARFALKVLEQKSLITVSDRGRLDMHDRIEEMGMNIVRRLHPDDPGKHSRLWIKEEIEDILVNDLGTEATRSIKIDDLSIDIATTMKGFRKMKGLRFLHVNSDDSTLMEIDQFDQYLPNTLRSLYWCGYPFECLPKTFQANMLVYLQMDSSRISQLWGGGERKVLNKLRFLHLSYSDLISFDLEMTPNLETLHLEACEAFVELNMSAGCPYLETLNLKDCENFAQLHMPVECPKLKFIGLRSSMVSNLNLVMTPSLEKLDLLNCSDLVELHMPSEYQNLETLDLGGCTNFVELHMPFEFPKLKFLSLCCSKVNKFNLVLTPNLETLNLGGCEYLVELHMPFECPKLKFLSLCFSKVSKLNLVLTPNLKTLDLGGCENFVELHMPFECPKLKSLKLSNSKVSNLNLVLTPNLETLDLGGCKNFVELHMPFECPKLNSLKLSNSKVSNLNLVLTPNLETLDLADCQNFVEFHMPYACPKLKFLNLSGLELSNFNLGLTPNISKLDLSRCYNLVELHMLVEFPHLKYLNLSGSKVSNLNLGLTPQLEQLIPQEGLEKLTLCMKEIKHLPDNICILKHLKYLNLKSCWLLEQLPKDLGRLESLEVLDLTECMSLQDIPNSICSMKCLKSLNLSFCTQVKNLPGELGSLECLETLNIEGSGIGRLPHSIFQLKDLCIVWSRLRLLSYGFTCLKEISEYTASSYVHQKGSDPFGQSC